MIARAISKGPMTSSASATSTFSRLPARMKLPIPHSANPTMPHSNAATEMWIGSVASSTAPFTVMDAVIVPLPWCPRRNSTEMPAGVPGWSAARQFRHLRGRDAELGEECSDPSFDLVADRADGFDVLAGGVVEHPVE